MRTYAFFSRSFKVSLSRIHMHSINSEQTMRGSKGSQPIHSSSKRHVGLFVDSWKTAHARSNERRVERAPGSFSVVSNGR